MSKKQSNQLSLGFLTVLAAVVVVLVIYYFSPPQQPPAVQVGNMVVLGEEIQVPRYEILRFVDGQTQRFQIDSPCMLLKNYRVTIQSSDAGFLTGLVAHRSEPYRRPGGCPVNAVVPMPKDRNYVVGSF